MRTPKQEYKHQWYLRNKSPFKMVRLDIIDGNHREPLNFTVETSIGVSIANTNGLVNIKFTDEEPVGTVVYD
jgi:hypothetical protein